MSDWAASAWERRRSPIGKHALINRYGVERVEADIMLGFFFPGAAMAAPRPRSTMPPDGRPRSTARTRDDGPGA